eukprot:UN01602
MLLHTFKVNIIMMSTTQYKKPIRKLTKINEFQRIFRKFLTFQSTFCNEKVGFVLA